MKRNLSRWLWFGYRKPCDCILRRKRTGKQGLPDKAGLAQRLKDIFTRVKTRQGRDATQPIELAGVENGHVAVNEFTKRTGILGDQLRGGIQPFLFVVTEIETRGDGINGVSDNRVAGRQRLPANGVIHKRR